MMLSDSALRQIIREYISRVRKAGIVVEEVRLFGSRAHGTPHEWSDIDLCIVSPQFGHDRQEEITRLLLLASTLDTPVPIEPIPFAPGDMDDRYSTIAKEIREQGQRLEV